MTTTVSCWPGWYPSGTYPGEGANTGTGFPAARILRWQTDPSLSIVPDLVPPTLGGKSQLIHGVKADENQ